MIFTLLGGDLRSVYLCRRLMKDGYTVQSYGLELSDLPQCCRSDSLTAALANTDCVVLPSYHEGLSNVLLEAAAVGRPLITSDIHGCKEVVDPGVSGFLCRVKDSEDLYHKMREMALLSAPERESMGLAGRRKIAREFEKSMVVSKTIQAIFRK